MSVFPWTIGIRGLINISQIHAILEYLGIPRNLWKTWASFYFIEMIDKAGNLCREMAGIEPTLSKSNDWNPLSPCQLSQGGCTDQILC
jgi:hypothetical protein